MKLKPNRATKKGLETNQKRKVEVEVEEEEKFIDAEKAKGLISKQNKTKSDQIWQFVDSCDFMFYSEEEERKHF